MTDAVEIDSLRPAVRPAAAAPAATTYTTTVPGSWLGPLKLKIDGGIIQLQARRHPSERVPTLVLDMRGSTVRLSTQAAPLPDDTPVVHGILGVVKLSGGMLLGVITKAKRVSCSEDCMYHVTETQLITHEATKSNPNDLRYAAMFQEALDAKEGGGGHMYFSHRAHITLSSQQQARLQAPQGSPKAAGSKKGAPSSKQPPSLWAQADQRFVWNEALMQPLIDAGAGAFAMPVMVGYMGQVHDVRLPCVSGPGHMNLRITLISRIDHRRAGTEAWRSGLDAQGACAHLVETEFRVHMRTSPESGQQQQQEHSQLQDNQPTTDSNTEPEVVASSTQALPGAPASTTPLALAALPAHAAGKGKATTLSFVQLRGSVSLLWSATPNLELSPRYRACEDMVKQAAALAAHLTELRLKYKAVSLLQVPNRNVAGLHSTLALLYGLQRHRKGGRTKPPANKPGAQASDAVGDDDDDWVEIDNAPITGDTVAADLVTSTADVAATSLPSATAVATVTGSGSGSTAAGLRGVSTTRPEATFEQWLGVANAEGGLTLVRGGADGGGSDADKPGRLEDTTVDVASELLLRPAARRRLMASIQEDMQAQRHGWFCQVEGDVRSQLQAGVVRMSCPGSLDLTNLLQCELGVSWLEGVLQRAGLLSEGHTLQGEAPALDAALRTLWANQGAVLADQIAGGGCASSALIRTHGEEPSWVARLWHRLNAIHRYYNHNFTECDRQDVVDVMTGAHKVDVGVKPPARRASTYTWLQLAAVCFGWGLFQVLLVALADEPKPLAVVAYYVGMPCGAAALVLLWVWWCRETYTPKPMVAPELTHTW